MNAYLHQLQHEVKFREYVHHAENFRTARLARQANKAKPRPQPMLRQLLVTRIKL